MRYKALGIFVIVISILFFGLYKAVAHWIYGYGWLLSDVGTRLGNIATFNTITAVLTVSVSFFIMHHWGEIRMYDLIWLMPVVLIGLTQLGNILQYISTTLMGVPGSVSDTFRDVANLLHPARPIFMFLAISALLTGIYHNLRDN